ncbi:glycosyltransferase [Ekhidna sp.]|uniref:glycosyltransferase n=1 Tax=Ekhidna sp. TaxID=2608089 RepID=UPI0032EB0B8C
MPKYSIIVPVFNRPDEIDELLESLVHQTHKDFEVLIVEDGSTKKCDDIILEYSSKLDISYFYKENSGQGFSRNYGFERAKGEWFIVFDSDCIIPSNYLEEVEKYLGIHDVDAFGGPDRAHESFSNIQKAISYSMTSLFTTGGIRGGKKHVGVFHPRSFNMGIHRRVFEKTKGYILPKKGEDIEFSIRIIRNGFKTALIENAFVYHKRRTNFKQFYKQLHFFGTARINIFRFFKSELKLVHFFPSIFFIGMIAGLISFLILPSIARIILSLYLVYLVAILIDATFKTRSLIVGLLSVFASAIQLTAYGIGFIKESLIYLRKG